MLSAFASNVVTGNGRVGRRVWLAFWCAGLARGGRRDTCRGAGAALSSNAPTVLDWGACFRHLPQTWLRRTDALVGAECRGRWGTCRGAGGVGRKARPTRI